MAMLGIQGKLVGKVLEQISDWQLAHPKASVQQCKEWLQASKDWRIKQPNAEVWSKHHRHSKSAEHGLAAHAIGTPIAIPLVAPVAVKTGRSRRL